MSDLLQIDGTVERDASRRPPWLKIRYRQTPEFERLQRLVAELDLHTVCQSAACPNVAECWGRGTATFMLGGDVCTRRCGFCDVRTGRPQALDPDEPERVGRAIARLGLKFAVITAVARDDVADGGASHFAETLRALRVHAPGCRVEVLIPDFKGSAEALGTVLAARPDVLNHNLETVERLQRVVRPQGKYERSLDLLQRAKALSPDTPTKTGLMLGLGEEPDEVHATLQDIAARGCAYISIGQYLRPGPDHLPVARWVTPDEFDHWARVARELGFEGVASGPLVRSSYRAEQLAAAR